MRKKYLLALLLSPIATMFLASPAFAADPPKTEYDRAMEAIKEGSYYITTTTETGEKYYLDASGYLTDVEEFACSFKVSKSTGGALYNEGLLIDPGTGQHFSNTKLEGDKAVLNPGNIVLNDAGQNRNDWERQVPFMNEEGLIAIRASNVAYGESGWNDAGRVFWTYEIDEEGGYATPCYSYEPAYVWTFEVPPTSAQVLAILNGIYDTYADYAYDPETMNIGTEPGQCADVESYEAFAALMVQVEEYLYGDISDLTVEDAEALQKQIEELYDKIRESVVPCSLPNGDGYYRIIANNRYVSQNSETGFADKAIAASYDKAHEGKAVYATIQRDRANFLWKLEQVGDSIIMQNAGLGTFVSYSSVAANRVNLTDAEDDRAALVFNYAGTEEVVSNTEPGAVKDIIYIRLASSKYLDGKFFHQLGHGNQDAATPSGRGGTDSGVENELSFWVGTFEMGGDKGTSEWYLEYVSDEEAKAIMGSFDDDKEHDQLVELNNALRAEVLEALTTAKDPIMTPLITSADQLSSQYSQNDWGGADGGNLSDGVTIDGNKETYWHSVWSNGSVPDQHHYIVIADMDKMVGDCQLYFAWRAAGQDLPTKLIFQGSDDPDADDEAWTDILELPLQGAASGAEYTSPVFNVEQAYPYVRVAASDCYPSFRGYWHVAELQIYSISENPNSQFSALGDVAVALEETYNQNVAISDEDITREAYEALLNAYNAFLDGMVDPTELRNALATYANVTKGVIEGDEPGQWTDTSIASQYDELYAEIQAYDQAGRYSAAQSHKYAIMLKTMQKSVLEKANGINTDTWYRFMYPTEEMYDAYGIDKSGGNAKAGYADEAYQYNWGNYVVAAEKVYENVENEEGAVTKTLISLEALGAEDIREDYGMYFVNDELIEDKDASLFRFIEHETDGANYTALLTEVKENMALALDLSTSYTRGEALITDAAQISSNATSTAEGTIAALIDGNTATYWHSDYAKQVLEPHYLQVALNEPVSGYIEVYIARRNVANGHIIRMYVQGSNDAENWTNIGYIETPYTNATTPATSQPIDLDGTYSYLRFTLTNRYGNATEFDPFAVIASADDYDKTWSYCHASEFQIYPLTPKAEPTASGNILQQAYNAANKVVLKDATAEDVAAAATGYKGFKDEFNATEGKSVLPNGADKAPASYAIQNKATGLFINARAANNNEVLFKAIPTYFTYQAIGFDRNLLHGKNIDGTDITYLHAQNADHRLVTWNATAVSSNSALVLRSAEKVEEPETFTFFRDIKPGQIYTWCSAVSVTRVDGEGTAYTCLGSYFDDDSQQFLALKELGETIAAGQPAFYIYDDTLYYDAESDDAVPMQFSMPGKPDFVDQAENVNGLAGSLVSRSLLAHEIYFSGNHAVCVGATGTTLYAPCVTLDVTTCPVIDEGDDYDFSIYLGGAADQADGIDVATVVEKVSQRGNVYSMDGKLLRTGATLNSLKSLGKGMYILNGVKVAVK